MKMLSHLNSELHLDRLYPGVCATLEKNGVRCCTGEADAASLQVNLVLSDAAIGKQLNAVDVTAIIGGEEYRHFPHIIRGADATKRHIGNRARFLLVIHQDRESGSLNVAGAQDVDPNPATLEIVDPTPGEGTHRRLRCVVDRKRLEPFNRSD